MRPEKKFIIGSIIVVAILLVVAMAAKKKGWIGRGDAIEVITENVQLHTITEMVSASGKIYPETEVKISPDVSGEIVEIHFLEGDTVFEGDLILKIRPDVYQSIVDRAEAAQNQAKSNLANTKARLAQAKAQLESTELSFERNKKLYKQNVISDADFETAEMNYNVAISEHEASLQNVKASEFSVKSAVAALKEAKDNLAKTDIYAPITGVLSKLNVEKGERVVGTTQMSGTEMLTVANFSRMEAQVDVSENDIIRITKGDTVEIEVDAYLDRTFEGIVRYIANSANLDKQLTSEQVTNFTVKISILSSSYQDIFDERNGFPFKPGMSTSVEIQTDRRINVLAIPIQAVTIREDKKTLEKEEIVYVYNSGKVNASVVKTGIQDDRFIEIKKGLKEAQEIVIGPYRAVSKLLKENAYVERIDEEELKK